MSMTKEEAIKQIEKLKSYCEYMGDSDESGAYLFDLDGQALDLALSALRPFSREQVEKMRGEWTTDGVCSRCGFDAMYYKGVPVQVRTNYCPTCGSPMTDKAVDMVMERLEALKDET